MFDPRQPNLVPPPSSTLDVSAYEHAENSLLGARLRPATSQVPRSLISQFDSIATDLPEGTRDILEQAQDKKPRVFSCVDWQESRKGYDTSGALILVCNLYKPEGYDCKAHHYTRFPRVGELVNVLMELNPRLCEGHSAGLARVAIRANDLGLQDLSWSALRNALAFDSAKDSDAVMHQLLSLMPPVLRESPEMCWHRYEQLRDHRRILIDHESLPRRSYSGSKSKFELDPSPDLVLPVRVQILEDETV